MDERRKAYRREADRMMVRKLESLNAKQAQHHLQRKRRRAIRHDCRATLRIDFLSKAGGGGSWSESAHTIKARVLDLSETGASLFTQVPLNAGQATFVQIALPDGSTLEGAAEVRWAKEKSAKGGYATGIQFLQLGEKQQTQVREFLAELDRTLGL